MRRIATFSAERLLKEAGVSDLGRFDGTFARQVMERAAKAIELRSPMAQPVTHVGWGEAEVKEVASNRRVMGPDGKVKAVRYTATKDAALRAEPIGTIDPMVSLVSFWNGDKPLAVLSYYACHPQSYYRTGIPSPDFPGIARFIRGQAVPEALHVHFNGGGRQHWRGKIQRRREGKPRGARDAPGRRHEAGLAGDDEDSRSRRRTSAGRRCPFRCRSRRIWTKRSCGRDLKLGTAASLSAADKLAWVLRCKAGHKIDLALPQPRRYPRAAHAGRVVRRVSACRQEDAARFARRDGGLRRLRHRATSAPSRLCRRAATKPSRGAATSRRASKEC